MSNFLEQETWKPILETHGWHEISNHGNVRSWVKHRGRYGVRKDSKILTPQKSRRGYYRIQLFKKSYSIHRLVARYFIEDNQQLEVNHIDGNKLNNHYSNLEWCNRSDNMKHAFANGLVTNKGEDGPYSKLTENEVLMIRSIYSQGWCTQRELANSYNVSNQLISTIVNNQTWSHI